MFNFGKIIIAVTSVIVFSIIGLFLYDLYVIHTEGHVIGYVIEKNNIPAHEFSIAVSGFRTESHKPDTEIYYIPGDIYNSIKIGDKYPQ